MLSGIDWSKDRLSGITICTDATENNVHLTVQNRHNSREKRYVVTLPIDRELAQAVVEAQNNRTHRGRRSVGGWGVTGTELQQLFSQASTTNDAAVVLQVLDAARDARYDVHIDQTKIHPAGFSGFGGDGAAFGAESTFVTQSKPQRDQLWQRNVLGVPRPADDRW